MALVVAASTIETIGIPACLAAIGDAMHVIHCEMENATCTRKIVLVIVSLRLSSF
jgi:hypothetical protein